MTTFATKLLTALENGTSNEGRILAEKRKAEEKKAQAICQMFEGLRFISLSHHEDWRTKGTFGYRMHQAQVKERARVWAIIDMFSHLKGLCIKLDVAARSGQLKKVRNDWLTKAITAQRAALDAKSKRRKSSHLMGEAKECGQQVALLSKVLRIWEGGAL